MRPGWYIVLGDHWLNVRGVSHVGRPVLTLPDAIVTVLYPFALLFQHRTWQKAQVVLASTILTPGQRTVASALRVMGLSGDRNYARYHHVLNRAAWSPLGASQIFPGC